MKKKIKFIDSLAGIRPHRKLASSPIRIKGPNQLTKDLHESDS